MESETWFWREDVKVWRGKVFQKIILLGKFGALKSCRYWKTTSSFGVLLAKDQICKNNKTKNSSNENSVPLKEPT